MIRLPDTALPPATDAALQALQAEIDALPTHEARVDAGRTRFRSRNRADDPVFRVVRRTLSGMCSGAQRCMYCEDSCADEVEHVRPKHLYPASVFAWSNYLFACGPCNGPKSSQFPLVVGGALTRCTGVDAEGRAAPPPAGAPALIDPRQEDPGAFLWVDLLDTFRMAPRRGLDPIAELRARATVDVLRLNREVLMRSRRHAYRAYVARLELYLRWRDADRPDVDLERVAEEICQMAHPTVWYEMKRLRDRVPPLHALFVRAPEALDWQVGRAAV